MKIAIGFIYVLWTIIYLSPMIPGNDLFFGLDKAMTLFFIGMLCFFNEEPQRNNETEKLFFSYLKWISLANAVYLGFCIWKDLTFRIHNTPIFAYIMGIGFTVFLIHCAKKK